MRVTNQMIFDASRLQTASARERLIEAQQRVTTGQRVVHPGDDPGAAGAIISHTMSLQRFDTINQGVARASDESQLADGALQNVSTLIARARELAIQLGNGTYSASERLGGAQEIRDISGQIVTLMNTQEGGRYLFGGNVDRTPPFDPAGNYSGDSGVRQVEVAPGLLQNASVRSDIAVKGVGGGVDLFAALHALDLALSGNDAGTVRASIDSLDAAGTQVATALTVNGGILNGFQSAANIGLTAKDTASKLLANLSEIDIFDAAAKLTMAQQSLEATLAVASKSFNLNLLDFLPR
jgi:flagellar hook-associated protein 3 FlgL